MRSIIRNLPRLGLASQMYLAGVAALAVGFVLLAVATWFVSGEQAYARLTTEVDAAIVDMNEHITREMDNQAPLADFLSSQKDLIALVRAHDRAGLAQFLDPFIKARIAQSITILDNQGQVLARLSSDKVESHGDLILSQPSVKQALSGQVSSGIEREGTDPLEGSRAVPLYGPEAAAPIGVLIVGSYLNDEFLDLEVGHGVAEYAIVYQDQVVASTIAQVGGKSWMNQVAPPEVLSAESKGMPSPFFVLDTNKGKILFKFVPLLSSNHTVTGMYGSGVSLSFIDSQQAGLFRTFSLGFLVTMIGTALVGLLFVRGVTSPIRSLQAAAARMATGDLSVSMAWQRNDELGDLARQMDRMREELRLALESSQLQQSYYAAAIRGMGMAAVITDRQQRIVSINALAEQLLMQDQASLIGRPWHQLFLMNERPDDSVPLSWNMTPNGAGQGPIVRGRFPLRSSPGQVLDILSSPVQLNDELAGYVHVLQDVTAQEQFTRSKDDFVLNVAHELRGPLSSLRVSVELLAEDYATMSKRDIGVMLRTLQKVIVRFQGLVESLVDVGNIQAGRFRVHPVATPVKQLLKDAIERVEPMLEAKSQFVEIKSDVQGARVQADPSRITQVLVNLLTNAGKYGPEDCPILLSTYQEGGFVFIAVTDQGEGIPQEEQGLIFKRFFRAKRVAEDGAGIGIGLALAKGIVEAHGGQMHLKSAPGQGTTFWFSLPQAQPLPTAGTVHDIEHGGTPDEDIASG